MWYVAVLPTYDGVGDTHLFSTLLYAQPAANSLPSSISRPKARMQASHDASYHNGRYTTNYRRRVRKQHLLRFQASVWWTKGSLRVEGSVEVLCDSDENPNGSGSQTRDTLPDDDEEKLDTFRSFKISF